MRIGRHKPTRREKLRRRADDVVGRLSWSCMRWYGRRLRSELPPNMGRWSAIAGGAGIGTAAAGAALRRRRRHPPAPA